jgi:hypothetical protein
MNSDFVLVDEYVPGIRFLHWPRQPENGREWWHYTLNYEPYPHSYFDFPIA